MKILRNHIAYYFCILSLITFSSCEQSDPIETEWDMVWSDEFEGEELNVENWGIQTGDGSSEGLYRWGNEEEQYYTVDNILVSNGTLKIQTKVQVVDNYSFTSGRIRSKGKGDFKYGRIEASIKMDNSLGLWHAFWMLPSNPNPKDSWPISGEIDIMEHIGANNNAIFQTIHFADGLDNHQSIGDDNVEILDANSFHTYAVDWDENKITWSVDSIETFQVEKKLDALRNTWPFDAEFHILLNTAVGGNLGGYVDSVGLQQSKFMEVDYVRVYQLK